MKNKLIFLILVLGILTQSYAYLTVKYSITRLDTNATENIYCYVNLSNNESKPAIKNDDWVDIKLWLEKNETEKNETYYILWWNLTNKLNVSIKYTAELFNSTGQHPSWVGNNPCSINSVSAGGYDARYWTPINPDEIGPDYTPKTKAPIPLGVVILTLIAIPLLTLKMVRE